MTNALSPGVLADSLAGMPGWSGDLSGLNKVWLFPSFADAIRFMQACVPGIDARNHHPEWTNIVDQVSVRLRTHDAGDQVTDADLDLAKYLDQVASSVPGR